MRVGRLLDEIKKILQERSEDEVSTAEDVTILESFERFCTMLPKHLDLAGLGWGEEFLNLNTE